MLRMTRLFYTPASRSFSSPHTLRLSINRLTSTSLPVLTSLIDTPAVSIPSSIALSIIVNSPSRLASPPISSNCSAFAGMELDGLLGGGKGGTVKYSMTRVTSSPEIKDWGMEVARRVSWRGRCSLTQARRAGSAGFGTVGGAVVGGGAAAGKVF